MKKTLFLLILFILIAVPVFSAPDINLYNSESDYKTQPKKHENILIILDCSYSMDDKIDGERKINIAKKTIVKVMSRLPENVNVGLRVYGHRNSFLGFDGCKATDNILPIRPGNQNAIVSSLKKINAVGWTPICYSLEQAIQNDFAGVNGQKRIILVSDGMETCGGDPCQFAVDLMKKRTDINIDVIGFNILSEPEAINQLKCVALATYGKLYTPNNSDELSKSLINSLKIKTEVNGKIYTD
jgi:hypothetical protein